MKMASNGAQSTSLASLSLPPGNPNTPYTLPSLAGEVIYIPCSLSATRLLVTGKETSNAFAVVGSGGVESPPIGFHFHRQTHDVFLCLKGAVNVWANDKARTMTAGDFASVPPGVVHQYQILGPYTEFLGLIVPGGWEEFFRFIGEPYANGPLFPTEDNRNVFEVLIPKLKLAAEKFDMIPQPQTKSFLPQPWEATDNKLPGAVEPYFLKNGSGPKVLVGGGTVVRPMVTRKESEGKFEIASIEGSSWHSTSGKGAGVFDGRRGIAFNDTHHCLQVSDGYIDFVVAGQSARLGVGETIYVPAGTEFKLEFASRFAKAYVFSNGNGLVELLTRLGKSYGADVPPEKEAEWDGSQLEGLQQELGFKLV